MQNTIWPADRLPNRDWKNCENDPFCNQVQYSVSHLLYKCRFRRKIWKEILVWCSCHHILPELWDDETSINEWWTELALDNGKAMKETTSAIMLVPWDLWKERNARVFRHHACLANVVIARIKHEAWC
jgi:hypothetical protein